MFAKVVNKDVAESHVKFVSWYLRQMPVNVSAVAHTESYTPCRPIFHIPAGAAPYTLCLKNKSFIPCRSLDLEITPVSDPVLSWQVQGEQELSNICCAINDNLLIKQDA